MLIFSFILIFFFFFFFFLNNNNNERTQMLVINLKKLGTLLRYCQTLKNVRFMINMERKVYQMKVVWECLPKTYSLASSAEACLVVDHVNQDLERERT